MKVNEIIKAFALESVGCPYIYGGTGQKCTPDYRKARIEQYPSCENNIVKNCPVLSKSASSCAGCKYNGKKAYDCAQLTKYAAKAAGLTLPSGASSQWNNADWQQKGDIESLPENTVCFLYQKKSTGNPMGHTGIYLGDGTAIDSRGHSSGVVHRDLSDVKWTHWGILKGQEVETVIAGNAKKRYVVTGNRLALREQTTTSSSVLLRMATGTEIEGEPVNDKWVKIVYGGKVGYSAVEYLKEIIFEPAPETKPTEPEGEMSDAEKLETLWAWYQEVKGG